VQAREKKPQKKQNGQVLNNNYLNKTENKLQKSNSSLKRNSSNEKNKDSKATMSSKAMTFNLAKTKSNIVNNLNDNYFKQQSENKETNNSFINSELKLDPKKEYKAQLDLRNKMIKHLEDKILNLEKESYEHINRSLVDGLKIQRVNKEIREQEDKFHLKEKEYINKINFLNEEVL